MLNVPRMLSVNQILRDLFIGQRATKPRQVPGKKRNDDEEGRYDNQPNISGPLFRSAVRLSSVAIRGHLPILTMIQCDGYR